ncbi:endonuclease/exonuclease/phosphatase family metal-dependent hydrolase [Litorimonas taeanensis]|uniref:Endonuclease/exonuclease/phosphatase family metal-dependent hydrolase n=1 Tax=Litorimonas taeanensis TaxID=568099 RepID=A0A420WEE0_9PROT|nr:endonuclease/exonuclease/phosphatase family protein [Litorimonas taeanensis]RKQ69399.1 endonuclease/exonuclease/phosphatase family metal-dependent hydrolase [Litorimonas taeanensis]
MQLKCLTWNIQAGIGTKAYYQYITQWRRQLRHTSHKDRTLAQIGEIISGYDLVYLQEVDLGGRRSNFLCQVDQLKRYSKAPYMALQENRKIGKVSRHGNALLSKFEIGDQEDIKLPGSRTGRGAMIALIKAEKPFYAVNTHLSLGTADQIAQMQYLSEKIPRDHPFILMGDLNCQTRSLPIEYFNAARNSVNLTSEQHKSYPSWSPRKDFDHVIIGPVSQIGLQSKLKRTSNGEGSAAEVLEEIHSDHRPVESIIHI